MIYFYIVLLLIIAFIEISYLAHRKYWGELFVTAGLLLISLVYGIAFMQDWQLPTLKEGVEIMFTPVTHYLEGLFG
ncbi:MAG TPA: hypothetical protein DER60_03675 [Syntrophomonas sp.]|nr:hypothetical protein [Syntrophomonas sp.]